MFIVLFMIHCNISTKSMFTLPVYYVFIINSIMKGFIAIATHFNKPMAVEFYLDLLKSFVIVGNIDTMNA